MVRRGTHQGVYLLVIQDATEVADRLRRLGRCLFNAGGAAGGASGIDVTNIFDLHVRLADEACRQTGSAAQPHHADNDSIAGCRRERSGRGGQGQTGRGS